MLAATNGSEIGKPAALQYFAETVGVAPFGVDFVKYRLDARQEPRFHQLRHYRGFMTLDVDLYDQHFGVTKKVV